MCIRDRHNHAESEYNARRADLESVLEIIKAELPDVRSLRDVNYAQIKSIKEKLGDQGYRRSKHVVLENQRVIDATKALVNNDIASLGKLMYQSHNSLANDYEVSCKELDFLVEQTKDFEHVLGSRMMGGGFGGCTINIVHKDESNLFTDILAVNYALKHKLTLDAYTISIEDGTHIIE